MNSKRAILLPKTRQILQIVGDQVKLARLRRRLSGEKVAERLELEEIPLSLSNRVNHQ